MNLFKRTTRLLLLTVLQALILQAFAGDKTVTYYHTDHLGSPVLATDYLGRTVWREDYGPWGEPLLSPAGNKGDIGYTGHYTEQGLGLTYAQARWYDQVAGVFLSPDAVTFAGGGGRHYNRYTYAYGNPLAYADPDGHAGVSIVFKGYPINTGFGFNLPLGHAGVLLIDDKTGFTRYYEYGRYHPDGKGIIGEGLAQMDGNVRGVTVPNVIIGKDGAPTEESLSHVYKYLSDHAGKGYDVEATYSESADFEKMNEYVKDFSNNKDRQKYSIPFQTCYTFGRDVLSSGEGE